MAHRSLSNKHISADAVLSAFRGCGRRTAFFTDRRMPALIVYPENLLGVDGSSCSKINSVIGC